MKKIITLTFAVFCLALLPMSAQKNKGTDNFKYHKATEIIENDGDPEEARRLLDENIEENPSHIPSYLVLALMDRVDEDYSSALKLIEAALKNNHKKSEVSDNKLYWWKAIIYEEMRDLERAIPVMEKVVKTARKQKDESLYNMLENLAQLYYETERYDDSDRIYNEMIKLDEASQLPFVGLARNMYKRGEYENALRILDDCAKLDKNYYEIYRHQMLVYEGMKDYKKMIDAMMALYDKSEDTDYISLSRLRKDFRYSVAVLKERIASETDNALWRLVLADLYGESHKHSDALAQLDGLIDEYGNEVPLLEDRARSYDGLGLTDLALADMNKVLEICHDKDRPYYHGLRGDILRSAGRYEEAIKDFSAFVDRYPTDAYGYYARGWCKELSGDLAGAMEDYEEGIAIDQDYPYIYLMRGRIYLEKGEQEKARADFETVIAKDTTVSGGSSRHYALHHLGKNDEALEWMNKIIEDDPEDPGNWYDKACLLSLMGELEEAVKALETSFEKGYRKFPHIENDDDMDPIRDREDFKQLMNRYKLVLEEEIAKLGKDMETVEEESVSEVSLKKMYGGTYEVPCQVNGLPLKMIFDTGATDVTISSVEASFMFKNGYLSDDDVKGKKSYMTASGDIHEGTVLRLKEVKLGDAVLKNIEASVVHSQKAPLLLGQSVLEKFGTITIDNVNSKLLIKQ